MPYRTELTIPVKKDPRTFEQSRHDFVNKLQKSYQTSSTVSSSTSGVDKKSDFNENWNLQRSKWIEEAKKSFDADIKSMRSDMFELEPLGDFDLDKWDTFGGMSGFGVDNGRGDNMMDQMERRMQELQQKMGSSMRPLGPSLGPHGTGSHNISSHFSSSSTRTVNDGGVINQSSNTTQESRQTIDGVSTGTKSHSSSSSTNKVGAEHSEFGKDTLMGPGAIMSTQPNSMGGVMNFLTNAFEVGEDGLVHFKVRFDAKDFAPEDIDVSTVGNRLTVHAKKTSKTSESSSSREFSRTVDLPTSIDHEHFQCSLTDDGVLILDAPVKSPDYSSIKFDANHNLSIQPKDSAKTNSANISRVSVQGNTGPVVLNDGSGGRKLHLEMPVEPEFSVDDISVRMQANKICVSGKREKKSEKSSDTAQSKSEFKSSAFQEFSKTFDVPETIDPFTVTAVLEKGVLVIEAPLLCTV